MGRRPGPLPRKRLFGTFRSWWNQSRGSILYFVVFFLHAKRCPLRL